MRAGNAESTVRALTFDVYGTVVDWRGAVERAGRAVADGRYASLDWGTIADDWRRLYRPTMNRVLDGALPWTVFDDLQRLMLDEVLDERGIPLDDDERARLAEVWGLMDPWPDAAPGITRLKKRYVVSTLSNGSVRQLVSLARHGALPWDLVLSTEMFHAYKPDPRVYEGARAWLQCAPTQVMMVAAHLYDLRAARGLGWRTAFVARPREWGPAAEAEIPEPGEFDVVAQNLEDLATRLAC